MIGPGRFVEKHKTRKEYDDSYRLRMEHAKKIQLGFNDPS